MRPALSDKLRHSLVTLFRKCYSSRVKKNLYAKLPTEQNNPRSRRIDEISLESVLSLINKEDQSVPKAVLKTRPQIAKAVRLIVASLKNGGRLFFSGAGTSGRLGVLEAAECPPTFGTSPSFVQGIMAGGKKAVFKSKEGAEDNEANGLEIFRQKLKKNDILVGVAASGVTPFVRGSFRAAKEKRLKTVLVTCNPLMKTGSLIDCVIAPFVGPEVITGSTRLKAGTATKLVLNMLTVASMIQLGKVYQNWMVDLQPKSKKLVFRGLRFIEKLGGVSPKEAERLFAASGKKVKVAILMAQKGWDCKTSVRKLQQSQGFLKKALTA